MALSIRDPEIDRLARELAALTGETMTGAIRVALEQRLEREKRCRQAEIDRRRKAIDTISGHCASLPVLDDRSEQEILGYDEHGCQADGGGQLGGRSNPQARGRLGEAA